MTDHTDDELIALAKKCGAIVQDVVPYDKRPEYRTITFNEPTFLAFASALRQQDLVRMARMREALERLSCIWDEEYPDKVVEECNEALSETSDIQEWMDGQRAEEPSDAMLKAGAEMFEATLHSAADFQHHAYHVYMAMVRARSTKGEG